MVLGAEGGLTAEHGLLGTEGLPEPWTPLYLPDVRYLGLGKEGKEGLCTFVGILRDFGISMKTLSHHSKSVQPLNK